MNDCGGRLGPARDGAADLRNLTLSYSRARQVHSSASWQLLWCPTKTLISFLLIFKGDILLILSDGVHDNLAPDVLGISPKVSQIKDISPVLNQLNQQKKFYVGFAYR